jgi:hypothetical protein
MQSHRRRGERRDAPLSLLTDAPPARPETLREHLANALTLVRCFMDMAVVVQTPDGPAVLVPMDGLAAIQARVEAAFSLLAEARRAAGAACCLRCGGTILQPTRGGVPRGACTCPPDQEVTR